MKTTIYAVKMCGRGQKPREIERVELCNMILYDENRISLQVFNRLHGLLKKKTRPAEKGYYWTLETAEGLRVKDSASLGSYVRFVKKED